MNIKVLLDTVEKIKEFVNITKNLHYDIDLVSGRNTYLDAKSIMGILSCDCSKPLQLDVHADEVDQLELKNLLEGFIVA